MALNFRDGAVKYLSLSDVGVFAPFHDELTSRDEVSKTIISKNRKKNRDKESFIRELVRKIFIREPVGIAK